jgi:hypothetical protein
MMSRGMGGLAALKKDGVMGIHRRFDSADLLRRKPTASRH